MFEKTLKLTEHLRRTSACLQSMGGNIAAAVKIIAKMKRKPEEKASRRERYRRKKVRLDESGRYGPSFPCLVCHSLNWKGNVLRVALTDIDEQYLCLAYIEKHKLLFVKKGTYWCCNRCKQKIGNGAMPANAASNTLLCPWDSVTQDHLKLSEVFKNQS